MIKLRISNLASTLSWLWSFRVLRSFYMVIVFCFDTSRWIHVRFCIITPYFMRQYTELVFLSFKDVWLIIIASKDLRKETSMKGIRVTKFRCCLAFVSAFVFSLWLHLHDLTPERSLPCSLPPPKKKRNVGRMAAIIQLSFRWQILTFIGNYY